MTTPASEITRRDWNWPWRPPAKPGGHPGILPPRRPGSRAEKRRFAGDRGRPPGGGAPPQPHRQAIPRRHPGRGIARAAGRQRLPLDPRPIDGTKSFIHGVPLYGTLIGLEHAGVPVLGVIRIPALDESVYAAVGQGAWYLRAAAAAAGQGLRARPWRRRLVRHQRGGHLMNSHRPPRRLRSAPGGAAG